MPKKGGWQKAVKIILILLFFGAGFFCWQKSMGQAAEMGVVINEIMVGRDGESKYEFIELFNNSNEDIDLSGYSLKKKTQSNTESNLVSKTKFIGIIAAQDYFLISHPDYSGELNPNLVYSGASYSIAMNNTVLLYGADGELIDKVGYGEAGDFESMPALEFDIGQSIERLTPGADTDDNSADFIINSLPSPGEARSGIECGNGTEEAGEECDDSNILAGDGCSGQCEIEASPEDDDIGLDETTDSPSPRSLIMLHEVVINELVIDPSDNDVEWVEIYNTINKDININGWTIEEGSGSITILSGELNSVGAGKYYIIEKPKGKLNNSGDIVILRDENRALIDQISYGNWDDGNIENNAPSAADPMSVARKSDGVSSNNNFNDFAATETVTKGKKNIISFYSTEGEETISSFDYSTKIIISELFPNPAGSDNEAEFIELYNMSNRAVNLNAWVLGDNSQKRYILTGQIGPREFLAIYREASGLALNNTSETVKLFRPEEDTACEEISYVQAKEGMSLNCLKENLEKTKSCIWSEAATPGKANQIIIPNNSPDAEINCPDTAIINIPFICDASDSFDMDNDSLLYFWDFGDGQTVNAINSEHIYLAPENYTISLTVFDGRASSSAEHAIIVYNKAAADEAADKEDYNGIIINEFLPNPKGSDIEGEWIELKNISQSILNLKNWQIDDKVGGSKPFTIFADTWLDAGELIIINREDSGIALNNSGDTVRLITPRDEVTEKINYLQAHEGASYARGINGEWHWTSAPTPEQENRIELVLKGDKTAVKEESDESENGGFLRVPLSEIKNCDIGDKIIASGTVAVLPGVFGAQYFYIIASSGIQIYNYKKDFPELAVGDVVEVQGELTQSQGELRIKTKEQSDMAILGHEEEPVPLVLSCALVDNEAAGTLVKVEGEVLEKQGAYLYLSDDSGEARIYTKRSTDIKLANIEEGDKISVSGIINKDQSGIRILPRSSEDIVRLAKYNKNIGQVMGQAEMRDVWTLAKRDKKQGFFIYVAGIAGSLIVIFFGLFIRVIISERRQKTE